MVNEAAASMVATHFHSYSAVSLKMAMGRKITPTLIPEVAIPAARAYLSLKYVCTTRTDGVRASPNPRPETDITSLEATCRLLG